MTTTQERLASIEYAEAFMRDLLFGKYKRVPQAVKDEARRRLRHFPSVSEIALFGDDLTEEAKRVANERYGSSGEQHG